MAANYSATNEAEKPTTENPYGNTNQDRRTACKDYETSEQNNIHSGRKVGENTGRIIQPHIYNMRAANRKRIDQLSVKNIRIDT